MMRRSLGSSGISVGAVGLGAGLIGGPQTSDADVDALLGAALDAGVVLVDAARSYGDAEERIGRALAGRRDRFVLSTKVGYGTPGIPDWTGPCVTAGVDAALARLRTDRIDLVHLHSCPLDVLTGSGVVEALGAAVAAGKVRVAAYSGEGEALAYAVRCGSFGSIPCSVSCLDQLELSNAVAQASARGLGVLAKRPLGNAPWRFAARPTQGDLAEAHDRFAALALDRGDLEWAELFVRFAAHAPGVSSILVGTASAQHLLQAARFAARGPLPAEMDAAIRNAFARSGAAWRGRV